MDLTSGRHLSDSRTVWVYVERESLLTRQLPEGGTVEAAIKATPQVVNDHAHLFLNRLA